METMNFSFIVAYRHGPGRLNNLRKVLDWIKRFQGVEVILVEQDRVPKLNDMDFGGIKYYFLRSELPFNKSWAFNYGYKYAMNDNIVFGDCDLIMDPQEFFKSLYQLKEYDCVSPYSNIGVVDLEQRESHFNLNQMKSIRRPGRGELEDDIRKVPLCGGIIMFTRQGLDKIGGWDESFIGWGGEDDMQSIKVDRFLKSLQMNHRVYHLWHPPTQPEMTFYQRNLKILNDLSNMNDLNLMNYINRSKFRIGMKNMKLI